MIDAPELVVRPEWTGGGLVVHSPDLSFAFRGEEMTGTGGNSAAIVALPVAMRLGRPLRVEAPVCPVLRTGLEGMATIWSTWRPDLFSAVPVRAPKGEETGAGRGATLMAYSGGIDSTHGLREVSRSGSRPDLLTVLGMDYRRGDPERFARLLAKTQPFRKAHSGRQFVVDSDAASIMRRFGIDSYLGFGFQVFACLHLFDGSHCTGLIASDYARYQEIAVGPRGTCTATNHLFSSRQMAIRTLDTEVTRGDKVAALADDHLALSALSFCKDYAVRPDNCGVCSKCLRTKAMFYAAIGTVPPIFRDPSLDLAAMPGFDLSRSYERVFALDMSRIARERGREAEFAPLMGTVATRTGPASLKHRVYKWRKMLASRLTG